MFSWVNVLYQLADYAVKAMVWYRETEAGAKEWADIQNAYETALATDVNGDGSVGAATAPQSSPTAESSTASNTDVLTQRRRIRRE